MAIFWDDKILLAEIESAYGVDEGPVGANAILAKDVSLSPMEGQDLDRDLELAYFGSQGTVPVEIHSKISFKVEMAPSGVAGTPPAWGPLVRACAVTETIEPDVSVTYSPRTRDAEALSIHLYNGDTRYVLIGCRGDMNIEYVANAIPYIMVDFTGLFTLPSEETRPNPVLTAWQRPQHVSRAFTEMTLAGNSGLTTRSFKMNFANQVEPRFLIGPEEILITGKNEQVEMTIEAVPLSTFDPYAAAFQQTELALSLRHGVGAGRIATLAMARAQMQRPGGVETPQNITEWPLRLKPIPTAGNDQWTLTLT